MKSPSALAEQREIAGPLQPTIWKDGVEAVIKPMQPMQPMQPMHVSSIHSVSAQLLVLGAPRTSEEFCPERLGEIRALARSGLLTAQGLGRSRSREIDGGRGFIVDHGELITVIVINNI